MQFVVLIYIFIQVHLPSDLLKAEQCQMAVTDVCQDVRLACSGAGGAQLGCYPQESSCGPTVEQASCLMQSQSVATYLCHFTERGTGTRRGGKQPES